MHIDVSRPNFHGQAQRLVLVRLPVEDRMGGEYLLGLRSQNLLRQERHQVSGMTHRDDFELMGPTERVIQLEDKMTGCIQSVQNSSITGQRKADFL